MDQQDLEMLNDLRNLVMKVADPEFVTKQNQEAVNRLLVSTGYAIGLCSKLSRDLKSVKDKLT